MIQYTIPSVFTAFHGGRPAKSSAWFFLAVLVIVAVFAGFSWWGPHWYLPDLMHYVAFFIIMALAAYNSVPGLKHLISPTRWWSSGIITALAVSAVFSAIPILIILNAPIELLRTDPFGSYIIPTWRLAPEVIIVEPHTMPKNLGSFTSGAVTFLGILCLNLAVSLSGMALGAMLRNHGIRGLLELLGVGIVVIALTASAGNFMWDYGVPAPWPGVFFYSIPMILLGLIAAHVAATKQTSGSGTRAA